MDVGTYCLSISRLFIIQYGNIHVLRKQVLGFFRPPPPLSSKVSIWHDPPLLLRKIFMTPPPHTKKVIQYYIYTVLLKGLKQIVKSLYLPEKNNLGTNRRVFVEIWEIMQIIQHFFPSYDYVSMTPSFREKNNFYFFGLKRVLKNATKS